MENVGTSGPSWNESINDWVEDKVDAFKEFFSEKNNYIGLGEIIVGIPLYLSGINGQKESSGRTKRTLLTTVGATLTADGISRLGSVSEDRCHYGLFERIGNYAARLTGA